MAAREQILSIRFVLFSVILHLIVSFSSEYSYFSYSESNDALSLFSPTLLCRFRGGDAFLHLRESRRKCLWMMSFLRKPPHGRNILLLRSGDVERNPGPGELAVKKMKKTQLTIVHVNTRSLPRHFDDVATLVSSHRPDVLALSET